MDKVVVPLGSKKGSIMPPRTLPAVVSGALVLLLLLVGVAVSFSKRYQERRLGPKDRPAKPPRRVLTPMELDLERRLMSRTAKVPQNAYWKYAKALDPNTIAFLLDPAFPTEGFLQCADRKQRMYLICSPGRGWEGPSRDHVSWDDNPGDPEQGPEDGFLRLHIYNNADTDVYMGGVGVGLPGKINGLRIPPGGQGFSDFPWGFGGSVFGRTGCTLRSGTRGNPDLFCRDAECPPTADGLGCTALPFVASRVDFSVTPDGSSVKYRTNNLDGFTMAYIMTPGNPLPDTCQASGGGLRFGTRQILQQCPSHLAYRSKEGIIEACPSQCKTCELEDIVDNCQCQVDADCLQCTQYLDNVRAADSTPPLVCQQNRCRTKMSVRAGAGCNDTFKTLSGDVSFRGIYCCGEVPGLSERENEVFCLDHNSLGVNVPWVDTPQ